MLSQMYIALPFSLINVLAFEVSAVDGQVHYDMLLPLSVFIFLWTNDTGAYCSGSLFGKHKLFPRISPGKSWEGSIGGGIFVIIVAAIVGYFANNGETAHTLSIAGWHRLSAYSCYGESYRYSKVCRLSERCFHPCRSCLQSCRCS